MDTIIVESLADMGTALAELAVKGTATVINKRIQAAKEIKDAEQLRTTYDALLNEVLQEREDAVRIAQAYKSELEKVVISDEDIVHLQVTVTQALDIIKRISPDTPVDSFETLKDLISVDTLKTMQLLGFNYKAAIGDPLTQICSEAILGLYKRKRNNTKK